MSNYQILGGKKNVQIDPQNGDMEYLIISIFGAFLVNNGRSAVNDIRNYLGNEA